MSADTDAMSECPREAKRPRTEGGEAPENGAGGEPAHEKTFGKFNINRVLNESSRNKMMCVEGKFDGCEEPAIVILEKTPFSLETATAILSDDTGAKRDIDNDIYSSFQLSPFPQHNTIKGSMVYPATQKHIEKYSVQDFYLIEETAQDYKDVTLPFLESEQFSIQWVYNILEKKQESERIVFEDPDPETGFILLPDMKWDCKQVENLYLVAIVHKHGIKSLRDLTDQHLPLLKNIYEKGISAIKDKFGVARSKLRIYLHYQPSYYHLHVHFTHLRYDAPGSGVERAHLLSDVINNLELDAAFYQKKTLCFTMKQNQGLCKKYAQQLELAASPAKQ